MRPVGAELFEAGGERTDRYYKTNFTNAPKNVPYRNRTGTQKWNNMKSGLLLCTR